MPVIEIELHGKDNASGVITGAADKLKGLTKALNQDAANALSTFGVNLAALNNPLTAIASGIKASIDITTRWGDTIDDLTRVTGESAEEASKMAVVLNDWGVSTDSLKNAAKALKDEGLTPSLSTLKDLAAEYQALPAGAARTEWGVKKLGRAYFDLSEVLSKTPAQFDEMSRAAAASGKIMDEAGIQKAEDFAIKSRQLGDILDGLAITVGNTLIPVLTEAGTALQTLLTWDRQAQAALEEHAAAVTLTSQTYTEYRTEMERANEAAGRHTTALSARGTLVVTGIDQTNILTETEWEHTRALEANLTALANVGDERAEAIALLAVHTEAVVGAKESEEALNQSLRDLQLTIAGPVGEANENFIQQQAELRAKAQELQGEIDVLNSKKYLTPEQTIELENLKTQLGDTEIALGKNADAHDEATKRIIFDLLSQRAAIDGLSEAELTFLNDTALKWGLVDQATHDAVESIDGALKDLAEGNIKEAGQAVNDLVGYVEKIPRNVNVDINVSMHGAAGAVGIGSTGAVPFQHGGSFIVPGSGSGDRPYLLNLEPGERVTITPRSVINNNGGNIYNYHGVQADTQAAYTRALAGAF